MVAMTQRWRFRSDTSCPLLFWETLTMWKWKELLLVGVLATASSLTAVAQQQIKEAANEEPLQEIVVTGSRIAAPNAVSTSPIQVISSESIATTGKTDISDLIMQLPQNMNNGLGQDLGNTTSGLTTAGGIATADLQGPRWRC